MKCRVVLRYSYKKKLNIISKVQKVKLTSLNKIIFSTIFHESQVLDFVLCTYVFIIIAKLL
jgi:hypothetical protein